MPHLTTRTGVTGALSEMGFGVPGYAHPLLAPVEWAELTRPGTPLHWAVLNVAGGPGDRPDPHCLEAAGRLKNAGVRVLGHLDLRHGSRDFGDIVSDAHRYLDWYKVDGYYLDRCPTDRIDLPEVRRTTATLEAILDGEAHLVLGHGSHPYPGYAETADQLVTFCGPWTDYRWSQVAEWTADYPPERFVHLVHGVPRSHLDEAMRVARWQGAGTIFFTDRSDRAANGGGHTDPFQALPGYWDEIVSRIGPGVSE
ncbi:MULTISPECIES: spherulation-specific family 4 protein [Streptomyces]|uniref:Spherulation-specific family 4 protein n=1 Tax=Streptomyces solicathayae TaxID=3081768 RepID=A0ABZ0LS48_9ACTN|nr:spherulation-specific family 4 protein [Streptomyces sp. HUAS YS2]WOX22192.1 spherulation-specific family 4 protein [Streptomyces sp. HUAS YS2]